jgi:LytS/YehU family sensor histidine kinase
LLALYLNVFVLVAQAFLKISFLQPLAPTQAEMPFLVAQLVVFVLFCALGAIAAMRFKPEAVEA